MSSMGLIDKEDVCWRIARRMDFVKDCTDDPKTKEELDLLQSLILCTVLDMKPVIGERRVSNETR